MQGWPLVQQLAPFCISLAAAFTTWHVPEVRRVRVRVPREQCLLVGPMSTKWQTSPGPGAVSSPTAGTAACPSPTAGSAPPVPASPAEPDAESDPIDLEGETRILVEMLEEVADAVRLLIVRHGAAALRNAAVQEVLSRICRMLGGRLQIRRSM